MTTILVAQLFPILLALVTVYLFSYFILGPLLQPNTVRRSRILKTSRTVVAKHTAVVDVDE